MKNKMNRGGGIDLTHDRSRLTPPQQKPCQKTLSSFILRGLLVIFVCVGVVATCDIMGWFRADERVNTVARRVNGYYNFIEYNNIDVFLIGNSHMAAGMEPYTLSCLLGCNCFIVPGFGGGGLDGIYYFLKKALQETHPKLAVIETYMLDSMDKNNFQGADWTNNWNIQRFEAQRGVLYKLRVMPILFNRDSYIKAWSNTVRNHSFLLTNFEQIKVNIFNGELNKPQERFELGRMVQFETGLEDSTLKKYDELGAANDGKNYFLSEENKENLQKIMKLFEENDVQALFLTNPMYYKNVANYKIWKERLGKELNKYKSAKWLDLQADYDSTLYTINAFADGYGPNQHLTRYGMGITAYKLAEYISKNNYNLPDRSRENIWLSNFISQPDYPINQEILGNIQGFKTFMKNQKNNNLNIKEVVFREGEQVNTLITKIVKDDDYKNITQKKIMVFVAATYQKQKINTWIELEYHPEYFGLKHYIFQCLLNKEIQIEDILAVQIN